MSDISNTRKRINDVIDSISSQKLRSEAQEILYHAEELLYDFDPGEETRYERQLTSALKAISLPEPNLIYAGRLLNLIERERLSVRGTPSRVLYRITGGYKDGIVVLAATLSGLVFFIIWLTFHLIAWLVGYNEFFWNAGVNLGVTVSFAMLGSVVSVLQRINASDIIIPPVTLFVTSFFKPLLALIFAMVVFSVIKMGVIQIPATEGANGIFAFAVVGFLTGFSERFSNDVINRVATTVSGTRATTSSGQPPGTA
jgi:hypothetical protein